MRLSLSQLTTAFAMLGLACQNNASGPVLPAPNLPAPAFLTSISLDSAIHLDWDDTPFQSDPAGFSWYRVYSTSYALDHLLWGAQWDLEGTTVSQEFLAAQLLNGVPHCFAASAAGS